MKIGWPFLFFFMLLMLAGCGNAEYEKVTVKGEFAQLSEEQFRSVGTRELENPTAEDFKKLVFDFDIKKSTHKELSVKFPLNDSWRNAINAIDDQERYWFGSGYEQNNENSDAIQYHQEMVIYTKGLTEDEIHAAFDTIFLEVSSEEDGEMVLKKYKVSDYIQ